MPGFRIVNLKEIEPEGGAEWPVDGDGVFALHAIKPAMRTVDTKPARTPI